MARRLRSTALLGFLLVGLSSFLTVDAQLTSSGEGGPGSGPSSNPQAAGYTCDATKCKLPSCNCATPNPPGGIPPAQVPQFITFTADDAVQLYTVNTINSFLGQRKNPNGCTPGMTYFVSLNYTNYSMVTDLYVAGNEIADHTMTHVGIPPENEINGNLAALNSLAGIPLSSIKGFRAPYLSYSPDTLRLLAKSQFTYDSSASASSPANQTDTDAFWPYTLDYGFANDCLNVQGLCQGNVKIPGFWEIPMYAVFDDKGAAGPHLMDPWLDDTDPNKVLGWLQNAFLAHYNGNRQPFGLYTHPIHLASGYPGVTTPTAQINMVNKFLDWAQQMPNVWIVTNQQMLSWIQNPVPVSQLNSVAALRCPTPSVSQNICNGIPANEAGLLAKCDFTDFPWSTCYGCPQVTPSPGNPLPPQVSIAGQPLRQRLPSNCSTPFWDPIGGKCLCTDSTCSFVDSTRPIGPNGANLTGGGTGSDSPSASASVVRYIPFTGDARKAWEMNVLQISLGIALVSVSAFVMGAGLVGRGYGR